MSRVPFLREEDLKVMAVVLVRLSTLYVDCTLVFNVRIGVQAGDRY